MALNFAEGTVGTLFSRLAELGDYIATARTAYRDGGDFQTKLRNITDELSGGTITASGDVQHEPDLFNLLTPTEILEVEGWTRRANELRRLARRLLRRHIWRDTSRYDRDGDSPELLRLDLLELRRQMAVAATTETVQSCAVGFSLGVLDTNVGNGSSLASTKRGDGLTTELMFAETGSLRCTKDGYQPDGIPNHEEFTYFGAQAVDGLHPDWGGTNRGSGARTLVRVIDPTSNNGRGNMLVNGFESFTSDVPDGWQATTGTATTDFRASAAQTYFGTNSLELREGTGVLTALVQSFDSAVAGYSTPAKPRGSTQYGLFYRYKSTGTPGAGTLIAEWLNSAGTVLTDDQAVNNTTSLALTGATSSWQTKSAAFRSPANIATGSKLRLRLSVAITTAPVFIDSLCFGPMTECYPGGPWTALAAGSTPFISSEYHYVTTPAVGPDSFTLPGTNDSGGASHARATWHRLLDALYDLRSLGILLPTSGTPTILDSAIG